MTANRAILDFASQQREDFLFNIYKMGEERDRAGQPRQLDDPRRSGSRRRARRSRRRRRGAARRRRTMRPRRRRAAAAAAAAARRSRSTTPCCTIRTMRDPRGYIMPSDQPDFLTATKFVNTLIKAGVIVQRATAPFTVAGKQYPAGSYVVKTAQAFRAARDGHVRAAGSPERLPVSGRPAAPAVRQRRLGRSRTRWASSSIASSTASTARSRRFRTSSTPARRQGRAGAGRRRLSAQPRR